jgi:hypothetical protein
VSFKLSLLLLGTATLLIAAAPQLSDKWQKRLNDADGNFQQAVNKADGIRLVAVQRASADRIRVLKQCLADITKAGDFEAATAVKGRIEAAEQAGAVRPRPKDAVKFGNHSYAMIEDGAPWHVAKRRCESMGGYLMIVDTPAEIELLTQLCKTKDAWLGCTDEDEEGVWMWINGVQADSSAFTLDNHSGMEHGLIWTGNVKRPSDQTMDRRHPYVCEWND